MSAGALPRKAHFCASPSKGGGGPLTRQPQVPAAHAATKPNRYLALWAACRSLSRMQMDAAAHRDKARSPTSPVSHEPPEAHPRKSPDLVTAGQIRGTRPSSGEEAKRGLSCRTVGQIARALKSAFRRQRFHAGPQKCRRDAGLHSLWAPPAVLPRVAHGELS